MIHSKKFILYSFLCSLHLQFVICSSNTRHVDSFLISCGEAKPVELEDGRVFESDLGNNTYVNISNTYVNISQISHIIVSNYDWLRLHFYPVQNTKFDLDSAAFYMEANGITLIHEF